MLLYDENSAADFGGTDFASLFSGGGGSSDSGGFDFSNLLSGVNTTIQSGAASGASGNSIMSSLGSAGGAALGSALLPGIGTALGGMLGGQIGALFGGQKTDETAQSAAINTIAKNNGISGADAAAPVAWHADHSSDNFNDLAEYCATNNGRFLQLVDEYNSANPTKRVVPGSATQAAASVAAAQQQLITTALTTPNFGQTAQGQQLVASLQAMPGNAAVGTQGQTASSVVDQILKGIFNGAVKGGTDAAAGTDAGKAFKQSYLKDWIGENQLAAFGIGLFGVFGVAQLIKVVRESMAQGHVKL